MGLIDNVNVNVGGNGNIIDTLSTYVTKLLKPNIVDGKNVLTQEMMSAANTKYVIKYDYVLSEDITVPANCVLEFNGGSISGEHTITGQNTGIDAGLVKILSTDVTIAGTWNANDYLCEWFGGDVEKCINTFGNISFIKETTIHAPIHINRWATLNFKASHSVKVSDDFVGDYLFEATLSAEEPGTNTYFINPNLNFIGGGLVDLNNKTCLIKTQKSGTVGGNLVFDNFICVKAAKKLNYDSEVAIVWSDCLIHCVSSDFSVERNREGAQDPDYGFYLEYSDNKFIQTNICISTIGIYGCAGTSMFNQVHVWGGPKIMFYITGTCSFESCYGDWAEIGFYYANSVPICISNYKFIGPIKTNDTYKNKVYYVIVTPTRRTIMTGEVTIAQTTNSRLNLVGYEDNNEIIPYYNVGLKFTIKTDFKFYNAQNDDNLLPYDIMPYDNSIMYKIEANKLYKLFNMSNTLRGVNIYVGDVPNSQIWYPVIIGGGRVVSPKKINSVTFYIVDNVLYAKGLGVSRIIINPRNFNMDPTATTRCCTLYDDVWSIDESPIVLGDPMKVLDYSYSVIVNESGTFADKPSADDIYVGFKYFCTDRQTTEGATNGIEIIHKGNNVWVDALGRVVS